MRSMRSSRTRAWSRSEGVLGLVEVGVEVGNFGFVDLVGSEDRHLIVDFGEAAFGGVDVVL